MGNSVHNNVSEETHVSDLVEKYPKTIVLREIMDKEQKETREIIYEQN